METTLPRQLPEGALLQPTPRAAWHDQLHAWSANVWRDDPVRRSTFIRPRIRIMAPAQARKARLGPENVGTRCRSTGSLLIVSTNEPTPEDVLQFWGVYLSEWLAGCKTIAAAAIATATGLAWPTPLTEIPVYQKALMLTDPTVFSTDEDGHFTADLDVQVAALLHKAALLLWEP